MSKTSLLNSMLNPEPDCDFWNLWIRIQYVILKSQSTTLEYSIMVMFRLCNKNVFMHNMLNLDAHNLAFLALSQIFSEHALIFWRFFVIKIFTLNIVFVWKNYFYFILQTSFLFLYFRFSLCIFVCIIDNTFSVYLHVSFPFC